MERTYGDMAMSFVKKRISPSDSQIRKHREQTRTHRQWKDDLAQIHAISSKLRDVYSHHKGDFALGRYEELKQMIKGAIKEYQDVMKKSHEHSLEGASGTLASKYSGNPNQATQGQQNQGQADTGSHKSGGLVSKLKQKAAAFTGSSNSGSQKAKASVPVDTSVSTGEKNDERDKDMATWGYEGMSTKQVEVETETMRKEVMQFKQDFRRERDRLDRLSKEYEDSKKHTPPQRYTLLKYMIKDIVNGK